MFQAAATLYPPPGTTQRPADLYELLEGCQHGQATCIGPADGPVCILEPQLKHCRVSGLCQAGPHCHRVCRDMLQAQRTTGLARQKAGQKAAVTKLQAQWWTCCQCPGLLANCDVQLPAQLAAFCIQLSDNLEHLSSSTSG